MLTRRLQSAVSLFLAGGMVNVTKVAAEKAGMWWRHGDRFDAGKLVWRPKDVARLDGCVFALDDQAVDNELRYLLLSGKHEAPERRLARRHVDPSLPVVEFGAAVGVVSCVINRRLTDPARHVVVEANPAMIPLLTRNRDRNGCGFTILNRAVAHDAASIPFMVDGNPLASRVAAAGTHTLTVGTTTLAQLLDDFGFDRCTVICDIEGAEVDLVAREGDVLASRVPLLIVEVHDRRAGVEACRAMLDRLARLGFEPLERDWETIALRNTRLTEA